MEALPTSFCSFFSLKILLARILGEVDNCACPSIAPCFSGVWAAAVIHGAALALDLDLLDQGLAVSRPWLNDVLGRVGTEAPLPASRSRASGPCSGCYAPPKPLWPLLDPPLRDGLRGGFLDLENGAIWPLNGLRAKKFHVFRIKGLDTRSMGR